MSQSGAGQLEGSGVYMFLMETWIVDTCRLHPVPQYIKSEKIKSKRNPMYSGFALGHIKTLHIVLQ